MGPVNTTAIGFIAPLVDAQEEKIYTVELMKILRSEFQSPCGAIKDIALKVVQQFVSTDCVQIIM
ncbi:hypothetical protein PsorP6_010168 [Peronosclerospora sorghi]|uniref:Uncharacterized protein n=1 Tax=Peronosclerospora sorghi TaxID=230839 RepID=A0ACC0VVW7_9STRA|nr:hypothetical protein PsorP6_010168 [Peronosclerospora sorghi]